MHSATFKKDFSLLLVDINLRNSIKAKDKHIIERNLYFKFLSYLLRYVNWNFLFKEKLIDEKWSKKKKVSSYLYKFF